MLKNRSDDSRSRQFTRGQSRQGVTVIEVLFSMVIALVGLSGIAGLLLLGGKQAGDSNQAAEAQAAAHAWYGDFSVEGLNDSAKWARWNDTSAAMVWFNKDLSGGKGSNTLLLREQGRESVCLDPTFFAVRDLNNVLTPSNWYRPSVFPYYQDRYNPLVDPADNSNIGSMMWEDQPRMQRVTWGYVTSGSMAPTAFSARFLEQIFASQDDMAVVRETTDASIAAGRGISFYGAASGIPLPLARFASESQYSWMATLSPNEALAGETTSTELYTLSLVVIKNRDRAIYDPAVSTPRVPNTAAVPSNNPQGERLAYVMPLSGNFDGGNGGRVRLISSDGVESQVHVGDWVMLSKYYNFTAVGGSLRPSSFFRWYRVVAVDSGEVSASLASVAGSATDVYGKSPTNDVWGQDVVLEGPDWNFEPLFPPPPLTGTIQTPTTATLVKGAASVYERIVNVP